jgi:peptidylprolyl isomerase
MKTQPKHYLLALLAVALPAAAQTTPVHHTTTATAHRASTGGCITLPELSSKIPALAAGMPCARPLYTVTRTPETHLDYVSPMIGPEVRNSLATSTVTYSLGYIDTKVGTGDLVQPGKFLSVKYTGYLADGTKFDSSYDHPGAEPIDFPYGQHRVIPGWDTGFEGMRIGGKRRLFIPYELAYGEAGRPPVIPAKAELIFDIEAVAQNDKQPAPKAPPAAPRPPTPIPGSSAPAAKPNTTTSPAGAAAPPPTTSTTPAPSTTAPASTAPKK